MGHGMELEYEESLLIERPEFYNSFAGAHKIQVLKNAAFEEGIDLCCQICIRGHSAKGFKSYFVYSFHQIMLYTL